MVLDENKENNAVAAEEIVEHNLKSRKRQRRLELHARVRRKLARERGQEYKTEKGKIKSAKILTIGSCSCKMECHLKICNERKQKIFDTFYTLNWSLKNAFI